MAFVDIYRETETTTGNRPKRIAWNAVFAGLVVVLAVQLVLGLVGIGFGAGSFDALHQKNPFSGLGLASVLWFGASFLIALFAGGWVAGYLANTPRKPDTMLHGVVTWGLASLATIYMLSAAAGGILTTTTGAIGETVSLLGKSLGSISEQVVKTGADSLNLSSADLGNIRKDVTDFIKKSENSKNKQYDSAELSRVVERLFTNKNKSIPADDKRAVVEALVANTDMSRIEATNTVDKWADNISSAKEKFAQLKEDAEQKAREASDTIAHTASTAAAWSAIILVLGAIAAALGGMISAVANPDYISPSERTDSVEARPLRSA